MVSTKMSHSLVQKIPNPTVNKVKLTMVSSMTIQGTALWVLKTSGIKQQKNVLYPICLYKITNFTTSKPTIKLYQIKNDSGEIPFIAQHANGITFAKKANEINGYLYVATMNEADKAQVLKINISGVIKKEFRYKKNGGYAKLNSINHIGKDKDGNLKFVVGVKKTATDYYYDIVTLKGSELVYAGVTFSIPMLNGYTVSNDIYYSGGLLYTTFFKYDANNRIRANQVLVTDISKVKNGDVLQPKQAMIDNAVSAETKYEIEGLVLYNKVFYTAANRESADAKYKGDGVFKLKKKA